VNLAKPGRTSWPVAPQKPGFAKEGFKSRQEPEKAITLLPPSPNLGSPHLEKSSWPPGRFAGPPSPSWGGGRLVGASNAAWLGDGAGHAGVKEGSGQPPPLSHSIPFTGQDPAPPPPTTTSSSSPPSSRLFPGAGGDANASARSLRRLQGPGWRETRGGGGKDPRELGCCEPRGWEMNPREPGMLRAPGVGSETPGSGDAAGSEDAGAWGPGDAASPRDGK